MKTLLAAGALCALLTSWASAATSTVDADYIVKYVSRAEMPMVCGRLDEDTSHWTSCANPSTATIYVDIDAGPALAAYVIEAQLPALRAGRYTFTGDPETCDCAMPWAVAEEVAAKLNSREH